MNNYDLLKHRTDDMSLQMARSIDFEIFYAPAQEDYELAVDLNSGKRITDGRTKGAKMLKKLKQYAREDYFSLKHKLPQ